MKISELTLQDVYNICSSHSCTRCPLWTPNIKWECDTFEGPACIRALGMYHLRDVIKCDIPALKEAKP